jgi:hypothetical protein
MTRDEIDELPRGLGAARGHGAAATRRLGPRAAGDSAGQPRAGRAGRRQGLGAGGAAARRGTGVRAAARRGAGARAGSGAAGTEKGDSNRAEGI